MNFYQKDLFILGEGTILKTYIIKNIILNMKKNEVNLQESEIENVNSEAEVKEKEVVAIPYQYIFENILESAKVLGQVTFVDQNAEEDALSNTISVIRMLSNGKKQFFKITVEETKELTIKK
jgi:hypothetical protein